MTAELSPRQVRRMQTAEQNHGGRIQWGARNNKGGALKRMCEDLQAKGYVEGPPYALTEAGRAALRQAVQP